MFRIVCKRKKIRYRARSSIFTDSTKSPFTGFFITAKLTFTTGDKYKHRKCFTCMFVNYVIIIYIIRSYTKTIRTKFPFRKRVFIILCNRVRNSSFTVRSNVSFICSKKILKLSIPNNNGILTIYLFHKFTEGILRAIRN